MGASLGHIRPLAENLGFSEGPLWGGEGRLLVASVSRGLVYALDEAGTATAVAETGGNPTGLAQDRHGTVWVAQGGTHSRTRSARPVAPGIQTVGADGTVCDLVTSGTTAPNDCVVGPGGRLWFTDPVAPAFEPHGPAGRLCVLDPLSGTVDVAADGLRYPNGLAFGLDQAVLYVAETGSARILRFEAEGSKASNPVLHADLQGAHPDGMAIDAAGDLYVAAPRNDVVIVVGASGQVVDDIRLPEGSFPTNVCFGGPDLGRLFITCASGGRVLAVDRTVPGAPMPI